MNVRMDASQVSAKYRQAFLLLRQLPGFDQQDVLRGEMAIILKAWAGRVKVGTPYEALNRARLRAGKRAFDGQLKIDRNPYGISVNTGARGGITGLVWYRFPSKKFADAGQVTNAGSFVPSSRRFKAAAWKNIQSGATAYGSELSKLLPFAEKSVGMARQSVIQIADDLGIDLSKVSGGGISQAGIAKARAAIASTGRSYKNGSGTQGGDDTTAFVQGFTRLPYANKIGMDAALASVLSGRAKFITTAYQKGAFASIATACKSFPNILTPRF